MNTKKFSLDRDEINNLLNAGIITMMQDDQGHTHLIFTAPGTVQLDKDGSEIANYITFTYKGKH